MSSIPDDVDRDCSLGRAAHRRLSADLDARLRDETLHPGAPSHLPDWTVGHLLTHLARNADGHRRMIEGAGRGKVLGQYVGGAEGRNADIEAGADRSAEVLVGDVRTSAVRLESAWAASDWTGRGKRTRRGGSPIVDFPLLRVREVCLHHIDLGIGFGFGDLDPLYLRLELRRLEMSWTARQPTGLTALPEAALRLDPTNRLAWLTGRAQFAGLRPADVF